LSLAAQQPQDTVTADQPVFRADVSLVRIDAQVVYKGQPVRGLTAEDFEVKLNGAAQPIDYFGRESEPLWIVLLLDVSGSMSRRLAEVAAVARKALTALQEQDQVAVMLFARNHRVAQPFTHSAPEAAAAIEQAPRERSLGGGSRINEAIIEAAQYVAGQAASKPGRRAIVIVTDNQGLAYQVPDTQVLAALFAASATLNAIVTPNAKPPAPPPPGQYTNPDFTPHDVFKLARETGGEVLKAPDAGRSFQDVLERLRSRYSLHFRPPPDTAAAAERKLDVQLSAAAQRRFPNALILARTGF
jgi:VWFA-related protein